MAMSNKAHLCYDAELPPWCLQRKAKRAKALQRIVAAGKSIDVLESLGIPVCLECYKAMGTLA